MPLTNIEKSRAAKKAALPEVRKLVKKHSLPAVRGAVEMLYDEKRAQKRLSDAKAEVADLERKLGR